MRKLLFVILLASSVASLRAQKVTGYWYGQANVEMSGNIHNNYLTELIIAQKGNKVKGFFGYYFKDVYQSFLVKGSFDPKTRQIIIRNIPIIYFNTNSTINSVDCITSFYGTLLVSKVRTSLTGYFYRDKKYEYTCPDLRVNYSLYSSVVNEDSLFNDMASIKRVWKPVPANYGINEEDNSTAEIKTADEKNAAASIREKNNHVAKTTEAKLAEKNLQDTKANEPALVDTKPATITQEKMESNENKSVQSGYAAVIGPVSSAAPAIQRKDILKINEEFKKRKLLIGREVEVLSDSVRLSFYDNAEVDGDSISVFLNSNLLLAHQELNSQALNVYIKLDSTKETNEISMFAENLGKYPPNTALMVVNDGSKRYEIFLSSDFKGNATVRFKRKKL
ncbi:MAG: hypothetical protein ACHQEM_01070 [Chitinophagales bacterium]